MFFQSSAVSFIALSASRASRAPDAKSTMATVAATAATASATQIAGPLVSTESSPFMPPPADATEVQNLPSAVETAPTPLVIFEKTNSAGPAAAAIPAILIMVMRVESSSAMNFSMICFAPSISYWKVGVRSFPICCAASVAVFFRFCSLDSVVA